MTSLPAADDGSPSYIVAVGICCLAFGVTVTTIANAIITRVAGVRSGISQSTNYFLSRGGANYLIEDFGHHAWGGTFADDVALPLGDGIFARDTSR